jgi:hypothetical protein
MLIKINALFIFMIIIFTDMKRPIKFSLPSHRTKEIKGDLFLPQVAIGQRREDVAEF